VLGLTCLLDRFMYGSWILVPLNFLKFNYLSSGGYYYGTHKWHWYFTQGFTVMIFSHIPFCIAGIIYSKQWKFSGLLAWVLCFYSILEFRPQGIQVFRSQQFTCACVNAPRLLVRLD
jgi:phosphatidylinositol glycan class B